MAMMTVPLANRKHSAISQIRLEEPGKLLTDGRILRLLSKLSTCSAGGECAWELLLSSVAGPSGPELEARLITHTSVPAPQRPTLPDLAGKTLESLLTSLREGDVAAREDVSPLPTLRAPEIITLLKSGSCLISSDAELTQGRLREHLCTHPGNGFSLLLVHSSWQEGELNRIAEDESAGRRAMLARDPVFDFVVSLWGPDAQRNAAWLRELTLSGLTACHPVNASIFPLCLRRDPWYALTLLPAASPRLTLASLSELLTICGCPAEPGEMQRMCRMSWREDADQALQAADISLLPMDLTLQPSDLAYMGLTADSDLEDKLHMSPQMSEMLRMCVAILRRLDVLRQPGTPRSSEAGDASDRLTGLLLPSVGHIYEQLVRECCYRTMYIPYHTYATGTNPRPVTRVYLSVYDQGPGPRNYRLQHFAATATDAAIQNMIREQMIDDFTACAVIDGKRRPDGYWYELFNDMTTARSQRNGLTHELADVRSAETFAKAFLLERPGSPSLLRRLLDCRRIRTDFPSS